MRARAGNSGKYEKSDDLWQLQIFSSTLQYDPSQIVKFAAEILKPNNWDYASRVLDSNLIASG